MTAVEQVHRLRRVARALQLGEPLAANDAGAVADGLDAWLSGRAGSLDEALGVLEGDGQSARMAAARAARDELLRDAAVRFFPGRSANDQAGMLEIELIRYRASGWRRDRAEARCPGRLDGRLGGHLWQILKARDALIARRTIRRVLAMRGDTLGQDAPAR